MRKSLKPSIPQIPSLFVSILPNFVRNNATIYPSIHSIRFHLARFLIPPPLELVWYNESYRQQKSETLASLESQCVPRRTWRVSADEFQNYLQKCYKYSQTIVRWLSFTRVNSLKDAWADGWMDGMNRRTVMCQLFSFRIQIFRDFHSFISVCLY